MKSKFKYLGIIALAIFGLSYAVHGFADTPPAGDVSSVDFLSQAMSLAQSFGGLPWVGKISAIVLLVIASMKVSFIKPLWDKVGAYQVFVAPVLSIAVGVLAMKPFSWAGLLAYLFAGAGAIMLHEILDGVKALPGLGAIYVSIINFFCGILGAPKADVPPASP